MGIFHSKSGHGGGRQQGGARQNREVTDADKAVLSLKTQKRKLTAERQKIDSMINRGVTDARQYMQQKQTERALLALRKRKLYEQSLDRIDAYLLNVEQVLANIEAAQRNNRLFSALKEGNSALAQLQKQVTLEDVERLNDESADTKEYQERLRDLLGESLSAEEDAAALEELEEIQAQQEAVENTRLPTVPSTKFKQPPASNELPAAPQHEAGSAISAKQRQTDQRQTEEAVLA